MSRHFIKTEEMERTTRLSYLLSPSRPMSPGEARFRYHGYFRGAAVVGFLLYFVYCNPEYSYTYTALRAQVGWDKEPPMFPQYLKVVPSPSAPPRLL
ncbi:hypothetical protein ABB37_06882 [Leptomonas pyrrhocoris]|uniref:Uncharacterized protein n=1 Tax=Leptomonas pyrrhocoris TaxID=157538 RepID=A0A0N0DTH5_LEPPY|nr:hypothetical protein ABB37_06882 [Leptomonas pyrrhocoris]XP_015655931.1 hypothetical protein ABB37_06882 [Leptomonas pyrrhocoris]KPA77491.1 hypothetical protein ABB37_06882 [Leptomonas pyrrhocoris]KPA77492.1 hypothetical protein ABB37_06882 [Leptomonas pyrrhocoris]|eukprot:XP_015655930.1 hypothetical protein ABB37_06882 [Leptomonas pyrrhocoris]